MRVIRRPERESIAILPFLFVQHALALQEASASGYAVDAALSDEIYATSASSSPDASAIATNVESAALA
jgi:hypothetical protein